eukprot:CAMPEP_0179839838 /NCGR_PEP_ID=MMETSP0982-20121206/1555_1 /TAXON_ID=483367 /ORGANISM="non described non described, Strain CCMP 2436" /LENGTH=93 /DNA_ID=CAMNT_0021723567 /DNA_START=567 /DNA_END=844 /DNA_ORIENTATION=+
MPSRGSSSSSSDSSSKACHALPPPSSSSAVALGVARAGGARARATRAELRPVVRRAEPSSAGVRLTPGLRGECLSSPGGGAECCEPIGGTRQA